MKFSAARWRIGRRAPAGLVVVAVVLAALTTYASPATADPTTSDGRAVTKAVTVQIPDDVRQQIASNLVARRTDGNDASVQQVPVCYFPSDLRLNVQWWYYASGPQAGLTFQTSSRWHGSTQCTDMNYMLISSNLWFRSLPVERGLDDECGSTASDINFFCGLVATFQPTAGYPCFGIGNCNGYYFATFAWTWVIPRGWEWGEPSNPICRKINARNLTCDVALAPILVPFYNL